jgi:hypothetical protein
MSSSGTWRCADHGLTNVSDERIASIFKVEKFGSRALASAGIFKQPPVGNNQLYKNREGV